MIAEGISTPADPSTVTRVGGRGDLMDAATLTVSMAIPLTSPELSFHYSGSLTGMDLARLNPFLEVAGHTRINSGKFEEGVFDIQVDHDRAKGLLRAIYRDLDITLLDPRTGSDNGILNEIKSFLTDRVALRRNNTPELSNSIKLGEIDYTRNPGEKFFPFVWHALRDGIFDVLGLKAFLKQPK